MSVWETPTASSARSFRTLETTMQPKAPRKQQLSPIRLPTPQVTPLWSKKPSPTGTFCCAS